MECSCHQANFPSVHCHYIQHTIIFKLPCARVELTPKYQTAKFAIVVDTWKPQRGINAMPVSHSTCDTYGIAY